MYPIELFAELKKRNDLNSDSALARLIGLTPARISQIRSRNVALSARQVASYLKKAEDRGRKIAFSDPIRTIVEMYPIEAVLSKQEAKWELLPTGKTNPRNQALRECLEKVQGVYLFYDSQRRAIYAGKTEKLEIWREMTNDKRLQSRTLKSSVFFYRPSDNWFFILARMEGTTSTA